MLDIETIGKGSNAAIVAIGACAFNPLTGEVDPNTFQAVINMRDSAKYGVMDPDTVLWWIGQSDDARKVLLDQNSCLLRDALYNFASWIAGQSPVFNDRVVWGNGITFDNVILGNAFKALEMFRPWPFWGDRDVRTIVDLGRTLYGVDPKTTIVFEGTKHKALDDAIHQAKYVSALYQILKKG